MKIAQIMVGIHSLLKVSVGFKIYKRQKAAFDCFFIPLLVEQTNNGLKCDKSFKKIAFSFVKSAMNGKFRIDFIAKKCQKSLWDPEGMVCQDQESRGIERGG